jgi:hypothetical protein
MTVGFSGQIFEKYKIIQFHEKSVRAVGGQLIHADGRTDKHDEALSRVSQILRTRLKIKIFIFIFFLRLFLLIFHFSKVHIATIFFFSLSF